ncbi:receptor-like protein 37 isoform X2 [Drosophila subpulchrella]|nr:receptor-like protein 37 isoform X2 [Drosophila subpulchrella]
MLLLNGNPLTWISPTALGSLGNLRLLDLSNCGPLPDLTLQGAHSLILDNSQLKYLDIRGTVMKLQARDNQLTNIRFADKSSVTELDLHNNSLTTDDIPFILMGMWRLQRLDLSNNLIHKFPGAGSDNTSELFLLPNLMHVNLSANLLQRLHFDSPFPWARLTHLDLSYNRLSPYGLPERAINEAFNLQSLHIQGNGITYFRPTTSKKSYSALKEVAFYDNKYKPEVYKNITKFFRDLKVIVLEKTQQDLPSNDSLKEDCAHFIEKSQTLPPKKEIQVHPVEEIIVKNNEGFWNTWNIFLLGILMTSLTVNAVQIRQRYRLRGRHVIPRETPISSMETMFVRDEEMLN